jgi:hypothetical protein
VNFDQGVSSPFECLNKDIEALFLQITQLSPDVICHNSFKIAKQSAYDFISIVAEVGIAFLFDSYDSCSVICLPKKATDVLP